MADFSSVNITKIYPPVGDTGYISKVNKFYDFCTDFAYEIEVARELEDSLERNLNVTYAKPNPNSIFSGSYSYKFTNMITGDPSPTPQFPNEYVTKSLAKYVYFGTIDINDIDITGSWIATPNAALKVDPRYTTTPGKGTNVSIFDYGATELTPSGNTYKITEPNKTYYINWLGNGGSATVATIDLVSSFLIYGDKIRLIMKGSRSTDGIQDTIRGIQDVRSKVTFGNNYDYIVCDLVYEQFGWHIANAIVGA
jgi:hypothetical protein